MEKTHAMRVLDARGIPYTAKQYGAAGEFHSGAEAARLLGVDAAAVFKTLVILRESAPRAKPLLLMIPVEAEADLKALAKSVSEKKLRMATLREAEQLTGMRAGGISALGLRKPGFEILLDESARVLDHVHISAGVRGVDLELRVGDLAAVTGARFVTCRSLQTHR